MEGTKEVQRKRKRPRPPRGAARRTNRPHAYSHPYEVRRKAVQLCLEEKFPVRQVAREMGVGLSTLSKWVRVYRERGEAGLEPQPRRTGSHRPNEDSRRRTGVCQRSKAMPKADFANVQQRNVGDFCGAP